MLLLDDDHDYLIENCAENASEDENVLEQRDNYSDLNNKKRIKAKKIYHKIINIIKLS